MIYDEALSKLGFKDFEVRINNRKILAGISEVIGKPDLLIDMTVAIDKLDKIGLEGVKKELLEKGFEEKDLQTLEPIILLSGMNEEKLNSLATILNGSEIGRKGIEELKEVFSYFDTFKLNKAKLILDITLARGLNYYTGAIFEVKTNEVSMGSIGGGGRYDDLTGMFGLKNLTGVGVSFGADRIYDVMEELNLFPENATSYTKVLITHFDENAFKYALPLLQKLRTEEIAVELYPNIAKMQKQMKYANDKKIPFVIVIGEEEMNTELLSFKNMETGEQQKLTIEQIINLL
jgi:histidyl-tRNA synthetase